MVHLETATHRAGDVTLVECRLESDAPRHVRVVNRLAGPVWPPRRRGVPAEGWDGDGVTVTVDGRVGVGYATPAPPAAPPAAITAVREPDETGERSSDEPAFEAAVEVTATPAGVVRELSDPRPPRDAIPTSDAPDSSGRVPTEHEERERAVDTRPPGANEPSIEARPSDEAEPPVNADRPDEAGAAVDEWLSDLECRIELLEGVAAATTLPEATTAVAAAGGLDAVESLAATAEADAERLDRFARRAEMLAGRATATEPDLATLRRLA